MCQGCPYQRSPEALMFQGARTQRHQNQSHRPSSPALWGSCARRSVSRVGGRDQQQQRAITSKQVGFFCRRWVDCSRLIYSSLCAGEILLKDSGRPSLYREMGTASAGHIKLFYSRRYKNTKNAQKQKISRTAVTDFHFDPVTHSFAGTKRV